MKTLAMIFDSQTAMAKADVRWIVREATWASRGMVDEVSERGY